MEKNSKQDRKYREKKLRILLAINSCMAVGLMLLGLWPFDFKPVNDVKWISPPGKLCFNANGIVYLPFLEGVDASGCIIRDGLSIELDLEPYSEHSQDVSSILCINDDVFPEIVSISQWRSFIILRSWNSGKNKRGYYEIDNPSMLTRGNRIFITITTSGAATRLYCNGRLMREYRDFPLARRECGSGGCQMVLGNDQTGKRAWRGEIHGLSLCGRELDRNETLVRFNLWNAGKYDVLKNRNWRPIALYTFDKKEGILLPSAIDDSNNALMMPEKFNVLKKTVLGMPGSDYRFNKFAMADIAKNVVGFIPMGFLMMMLLHVYGKQSIGSRAVMAALTGVFVSIVIEIVQVFIPSRFSSIIDVMGNTFGTLIGVLAWLLSISFAKNKSDFSGSELCR